ncbi:hypothetical protein AMS60_05660 [Bacillus sp. FJAT-21945]|nr:hypothetical protein AMS60_05660 [Bacillus sp. FJAT-21945]
MKTLKLVKGDLEFKNGDLVMVEGDEELQQCIEIVLGTNKGEWFLNPELGIDFNKIREKSTDGDIENEIIEGVSQEPRIETIESLEIKKNKTNRQAEITFNAVKTDGGTIDSEVIVNA